MRHLYCTVLFLAACAAPIGEEDEAVYNGTPLASTDRVVTMLNPGAFCTGSMITNSWMLSAAHCYGYPGLTAAQITVYLNGSAYGASQLVVHPTLDFALVQLSSPAVINGSTTGFKGAMYTYSAESLDQKAVQLEGESGSNCDGSGTSELRAGYMKGGITQYPMGFNWGDFDQYNVPYVPSDGSSAVSGDSGAPFFRIANGVTWQTGILKSSQCPNPPSVGARPENFEPWVFGVVYGGPTPIPTTNHIAGDKGWTAWLGDQNQGQWFMPQTACDPTLGNYRSPCNISTGQSCNVASDCANSSSILYAETVGCQNHKCVDGQFWTRPLAPNSNRSTWAWNPCPGSNNYYRYTIDYSLNSTDSVAVTTQYRTDTFTGTNDYWAWGLGNMSVAYSTGANGQSPGVNFLNVQCCNKPGSYNTCYDTPWISQNEKLVCHGGRCGNTVDPLPNNFYQVVTWNPCNGGAFYYFLDYSTVYPDNIWIQNGGDYYGTGHVNWVYEAGPAEVSIATDPSTMHYSHGIRSLTAVCAGW